MSLSKKITINNGGFVRLVEVMGCDRSVAEAARVSYGDGTRSVSDDEKLIRYLMRHNHTSPFEMVEMKFHVRVPMDTWRQWIRHRTANVNEYSTRYSVAIDQIAKTRPGEWRLQAKDNKQGSSGYLSEEDGRQLSIREQELHEHAKSVYYDRLDAGIAREQARKDLPLSTFTEAIWKCDLHNIFHFLHLRMDLHSQEEIRRYANVIGEFVEQHFPVSWRAFVDYRLDSMRLSSMKINVLRELLTELPMSIPDAVLSNKIDNAINSLSLEGRERKECLSKLHNLIPSWKFNTGEATTKH